VDKYQDKKGKTFFDIDQKKKSFDIWQTEKHDLISMMHNKTKKKKLKNEN